MINFLPKIAYLLVLVLTVGCAEQRVDRDQLVERDGIFYKKFSTEPFSGQVTGRISGRMSSGLLEGVVNSFDENGQLTTQAVYVNGIAEGDFYEFHPNGQLKTKGQNRRDQIDGLTELFRPSGELEATINYKAGEGHGLATFFRKDGKVWFSQEYKNGRADGEYLTYFESGPLQVRGGFKNGLAYGKWNFFNEEGEPSSLQLYLTNRAEANVEDGPSASFYANGFVEYAGMKRDGKRDGVWRFYNEHGELLKLIRYLDGEEMSF